MVLEDTVARPIAQRIYEGQLHVVGSSTRHDVREEPITIGRDPACHVVLDDPEVSAVHLEVSADTHGIRLRDLGSANGTFVGDVRVSDVHLTAFQRVRAGSAIIEIVLGGEQTVPLAETTSFGALVGASAVMRALFERLARAARTELTVLILGETGSGKELVARALHEASPRAKAPFVVVDCAAIPRTLGESTLLGHEKGAFTGADRARPSPFVEANGGTIFLDELGELPLEIQPNLLRVLAERRVKPVGSSRYSDVDVRVIAATRQNLLAQVNAGSFRSDLYFRLAQVRVQVPPLRDRREDIPLILAKVFEDLGDPSGLSRVPLESLERLAQHDFPGNVRELRNAATVAHALAGDGPLDVAQYVQEALEEVGGPTVRATPSEASGLVPYHEAKRVALEQFEKEYFEQVVKKVPDNISEMSRLTGLSRLHIRKHLQHHRIAVGRPGQRG